MVRGGDEVVVVVIVVVVRPVLLRSEAEAFRSGPIGTSVAGGGNSQLHPILSLSFDTDSLWLARLASNFIPFSFSLFLPDQSQWVVLLTLRTECELSLLRSQVGLSGLVIQGLVLAMAWFSSSQAGHF